MRKFALICLVIQSVLLFGQTLDSKGQKQGYWKKKDEKTNKLIYEGEFKDNKPIGKFKYYHPNDSISVLMIFKDGSKIAYAKMFHLNGKRKAEGKYVGKEIKDSVWNYYDELGVLIAKEKYKEGKKHGASFVYIPDGSVSEEKYFKDDVMDGPYKEYFTANVLRSQATYSKGLIEGRTVYYYPNGVEVAVGFYKNGNKVGPWIYKTESGKIREKELYKNGKLVSTKETDEFFAKNKPESIKLEPKKTGSKK